MVDVDQRQLALPRHGVDTWFADLRVGLPAPLRGRFDIVLTDPPYSPAGVGLFAARALEASKREARLLVAYGYPEGSPALGLKVQAELSALELVYEARAAGLQRLRGRAGDRLARAAVRAAADQAQREDRRAARRAARRGALHARAPGRRVRGGRSPDLSAGSAPTAGRRSRELLESARRAPRRSTSISRPHFVYSLYQAVVAAAAPRVVILTTTAPRACAPRPSRRCCGKSPRRVTRSSSSRVPGRARRSRSSSCAAAGRATSARSTGTRPRPRWPGRQRRAPVLQRRRRRDRVARARDGDLAAQGQLGERVGEALGGGGAVARVLR